MNFTDPDDAFSGGAFGGSAFGADSGAEAGFSGILDSVSASLIAAFSPRRLLTSFTSPPMRMRIQPGTTEADIAFNGTFDNIDTAARDTLLGSSEGRLVTYYNQLGSNNATQATAGSQPITKDGSGVIAVNTKQCIKGTGVGGQPLRVVTPSIAHGIGTGDFLVSFSLLHTSPVNAENALACFGSYAPSFYSRTTSGGAKPAMFFGGYRVFATTLTAGQRYVITFARTSGVLRCWVNGTLDATTFSVATSIPTSAIALINDDVNGFASTNDCVAEFIFCKSGVDATARAAIIASQMSFLGL